MSTKNVAIGVDIGGSHISCMAFDLDKQELLAGSGVQNEVDNHAEKDVIIQVWGDALYSCMKKAGVDKVLGVGFAMPGPFDYEKGISLFTGENEKFENTHGLNVPEAIREYLNLSSDFPIRFINDATAFAMGESGIGQAKEVSRSLSITLGTGFGSAFIRDGVPVVEGEEVPEQGCLWHLPFKEGIADDYFSTRGLLKRYEALSGIKYSGVKEIAVRYESDPHVKELFDDFGLQLGTFLAPWIQKFSIEMLVIGGNISRAYHLFQNSLLSYLENEGLSTQVAISELKEDAAFVGSAVLVDDGLYERLLPALRRM